MGGQIRAHLLRLTRYTHIYIHIYVHVCVIYISMCTIYIGYVVTHPTELGTGWALVLHFELAVTVHGMVLMRMMANYCDILNARSLQLIAILAHIMLGRIIVTLLVVAGDGQLVGLVVEFTRTEFDFLVLVWVFCNAICQEIIYNQIV